MQHVEILCLKREKLFCTMGFTNKDVHTYNWTSLLRSEGKKKKKEMNATGKGIIFHSLSLTSLHPSATNDDEKAESKEGN